MIQTKKLLIVYWDMGLGGIQKRIRDIAIDISENYPTWETNILLRKKCRNGFDGQIINKTRVNLLYYPSSFKFRFPLGFMFWIFIEYILIKPRGILTFQPLLSTLLIIIRKIIFWIPAKLVLNEGAVTTNVLNWENLIFWKWLIILFYPLADKIIVPTQACKTDLLTHYYIKDKKISVIKNWTLFEPVRPSRSKYDIIYAGRFDPEKNPLMILHVIKELILTFPNIRAIMIGDGKLKTTLIKTIHHEKLDKFIQVKPFTHNIKKYFKQSKLLVLPSLNEGMPNVVLEAAMFRVPSVVNNFLGSEEVVQHGITGFISKSDKQFILYIRKFLEDKKLRTKAGINAQKYIRNSFSKNNQNNFIANIIN